jgi:hypothetical protein
LGSVFALVSPGGSPGATTAAIALALGWPGPAIVAECDPGGGTVLAGTLAGHVPAGVGLMEHAIELVPLDADRTRRVLPGLTDPRQAAGLRAAWPAVAMTLTAQNCDVIADCGRLDASDGQPLAVLTAASVVAVVLRPTLRQVWAARSRIDMLAQLLGGTARVVLLITGPGTHPAREIAGTLSVPVAAVLPADARSAVVLSDGGPRRRQFGSGPLIAAAQGAGHALRKHAAAQVTSQAAAPATFSGARR